jgi:hypothetical protein
VIAGTLIFSKEAPDILWGLGRNLSRLGALPEKLVWDRESAIAAGGRPTSAFAAFCGALELGWVILEARDPQAKIRREGVIARLGGPEGKAASRRPTTGLGAQTRTGSALAPLRCPAGTALTTYYTFWAYLGRTLSSAAASLPPAPHAAGGDP